MKKVVVPTDFSENSKAGIRFALQWSKKEKLELIFVHALNILRPFQWSDSYFLKYAAKQMGENKKKLQAFVDAVCKKAKIKPARYSSNIISGFSADLAIIEYCVHRNDIDFICMSTTGTGGLKRLLGTNTGNLITKSQVPVIAVPKNYRMHPINQLMYAADFENTKEELKRVVAFARPLKSKVDILHFTWPDEAVPDKEIIESGIRKLYKLPIELRLEKPEIKLSLIENLQNYIRKVKPSLVILFTHRDRTFFQKVIFPGNAERLSFQLEVPLLVFNKNKMPAK